MISAADRLKIAESILNFEARRDSQNRLKVYKLDPSDGGGSYEVAGINEKYHPEEARHLADLIGAGRYAEAETQATEIIATFTDAVTTWTNVAAIESYLRDSAFNRGPRGAARILQTALGMKDDGVVGNDTRTALAAAEKTPDTLLRKLRDAREDYERRVVGRDESSIFWKGLVNRWNNALTFARKFLDTSATEMPAIGFVAAHATASPQAAVAFAAPAAIHNALSAKIAHYSEMLKLADFLPINVDLSSARERTMVSLLGSPKLPLTTSDQPERASPTVKALRQTGRLSEHITVHSIRPALASLAEVLNAVFSREPDLAAVLGTEGMLSVRYRNPIHGPPSTTISNHAWGTAIDFKIVGHAAPTDTRNKVPRFIAVMLSHFHAAGWYSGISFHDTMHFEVAEETVRRWSQEGRFRG